MNVLYEAHSLILQGFRNIALEMTGRGKLLQSAPAFPNSCTTAFSYRPAITVGAELGNINVIEVTGS